MKNLITVKVQKQFEEFPITYFIVLISKIAYSMLKNRIAALDFMFNQDNYFLYEKTLALKILPSTIFEA